MVIWELTGTGKSREKPALRAISIAFFILSLYILAQSVRTLLFQIHPATSLVGIGWLFVTFAVMLARGKARLGEAIDNPVLQTEGRVTLVDAYLAGAVLLPL